MQIAIDGPAGAGKSTVAKAIAKKLHINYMDTGAMYRAVAYGLLKKGVNLKDAAMVAKELKEIDLKVIYVNEEQRVVINGEDVTPYIRTPEVSMGASDVGAVPEVRIKLVEIQRETAAAYDVVMDGRDIGTYVLPDTKAKFYITASSKERALRRGRDLIAAGMKVNLDALEQEIIARDKQDSEREFAPLRCAEDAVYLDTSDMSIEQVIGAVCERIEEIYGK